MLPTKTGILVGIGGAAGTPLPPGTLSAQHWVLCEKRGQTPVVIVVS